MKETKKCNSELAGAEGHRVHDGIRERVIVRSVTTKNVIISVFFPMRPLLQEAQFLLHSKG